MKRAILIALIVLGATHLHGDTNSAKHWADKLAVIYCGQGGDCNDRKDIEDSFKRAIEILRDRCTDWTNYQMVADKLVTANKLLDKPDLVGLTVLMVTAAINDGRINSCDRLAVNLVNIANSN